MGQFASGVTIMTTTAAGRMPYHVGVSGAPLLTAAVAYIEATVHSTLEAGDHSVIVGQVTALEVRSEVEPLVYYRSGYRRLG